jgi:hypothetical protein
MKAATRREGEHAHDELVVLRGTHYGQLEAQACVLAAPICSVDNLTLAEPVA